MYLILAQTQVSARSLGAWLELLGETPLVTNAAGATADPRCLVWAEPVSGEDERTVAGYERMVRWVEGAAGTQIIALNELVVLVDAIDLDRLDPLSETSRWNGIVAMLILTFPEIRWIFGVIGTSSMTSQMPPASVQDQALSEGLPGIEFLVHAHGFSSLLATPRRDPLFDPTGLREWVRFRIRSGAAGSVCCYLPVRKRTAAAIDEEKSYAYFHGYLAYRFGYRCDVVTSWSLMKQLFGVAAPLSSFETRPTPHGYALLIEDMSLNFPDRQAHTHILRLKAYTDHAGRPQGRAYHLPKLNSTSREVETSDLRLLVTAGQGLEHHAMSLKENLVYLEAKATGRGHIEVKPGGGMFELWRKAGLLDDTGDGGRRPGDTIGFRWPPVLGDFASPANSGDNEIGHGAPGRLLLIAENLLRRAGALQQATTNVSQEIQGAVLATDALELLGGRTPTSSAEALTLKHLLELQAECHFSGVEYHFKVGDRLKELEIEAKAIASCFDRDAQEKARLNILMDTANRLVRLLRDENQFDEEQLWMNRARHWHNSLWISTRAVKWPYMLALRYSEALLSSFPAFTACIAAWVGVLTLLFMLVRPLADLPATGAQDLQAFGQAIATFFGSSTFDSHHPVWVSLTVFAVLAGFVHLGILISYLYSLVSRK